MNADYVSKPRLPRFAFPCFDLVSAVFATERYGQVLALYGSIVGNVKDSTGGAVAGDVFRDFVWIRRLYACS